ncbi:CheR family methyltransferase [Caulobacter mirabilis]|uniref:Chemotaxis protein methyltransferase n=1 Tax=Caulobacter mirabilis TaxID=69666 RepID=A0A2D2B1U5_9CAUL|nr:protein-glutamate O-methyltransferase CheR [Caulobacter mirabilis]ATQ44188.1 chemotaxis protein [Caulobacter mirabilis]
MTGVEASSRPVRENGREFAFTPEDFRTIAAVLHGDAGIYLPESKSTLVYSRLAKRLRLLGISSFKDYCKLIQGSHGVDERQAMLAALTTNVTRFFREPHHFDHLKNTVMPALAARARAGGRVRLWSAACSTGQEPYSMALSVLAALPDALRYDVKILATDIDPNVVAAARTGVYSRDLLEAVPASDRKLLRRAPDAGADMWRFADEVQELIAFRELNLVRSWPMSGKFDVIFCRNVVIYFDDATQEAVWKKFIDVMTPGGRLYIGHSERVTGDGGRLQSDGLTVYKMPGDLR